MIKGTYPTLLPPDDRTCSYCEGPLTATCCEYQRRFAARQCGEWRTIPPVVTVSRHASYFGRLTYRWKLLIGKFTAIGFAATEHEAQDAAHAAATDFVTRS